MNRKWDVEGGERIITLRVITFSSDWHEGLKAQKDLLAEGALYMVLTSALKGDRVALDHPHVCEQILTDSQKQAI